MKASVIQPCLQFFKYFSCFLTKPGKMIVFYHMIITLHESARYFIHLTVSCRFQEMGKGFYLSQRPARLY